METFAIEALDEIVLQRWEASKTPVLFAQVPGLLKARGIDYRDVLNGLGLKDAILLSDMDKTRAIQDPNDPKIWALVPSNFEGSPSTAFANYASKKRDHATSPKRVRYLQAVWKAFTVPLKEGFARYLCFEPTGVAWQDFERGEMLPQSGGVIVPRELICEEQDEVTYEVVDNRIRGWVQENKTVTISDVTQMPIVESKPNFWRQFGDLPDGDLARVLIPADIVKKLISGI